MLRILLSSLFLVTLAQAQKAPQPDQQIIYKTVESGPLKLHVFYPDSQPPASPTPAIVLFHGGGFSKGAPRDMYHQSGYLASRGLVVIAPEYRLNNNNIECLRDAKSAMRFVFKNAAQLGVDPKRVAAGGGSAGGCLAAALSTSKLINDENDDLSISPVPSALLLLNPVYTSRGAFKEPDALRKDFTPMNNIHSDMPPTLVLFGDLDKFVDVPTMKQFQQKMIDAGIRSELEIYAGEKHAFFNHGKQYYQITLRRMDTFLSSLGFISGEPTI